MGAEALIILEQHRRHLRRFAPSDPSVAGDPPRPPPRPLAVHRPGAPVAGPGRHDDQEPHFVARGGREGIEVVIANGRRDNILTDLT